MGPGRSVVDASAGERISRGSSARSWLLGVIALFALIAIAVVYRVSTLAFDGPTAAIGGGDGIGYIDLAKSIARGDLDADLFIARPPGYPLAISVVSILSIPRDSAAVVVSIVCAVATLAVVYLLARRWQFPFFVAVLAVLFTMSLPTFVFSGAAPLTESLLTLLFTLGIYIATTGPPRGRRLVALVLVVVAACLVKPIGVTLGVAIGVWLVVRFRRQALRPVAATGVAVLATVLVWSLLNLGLRDNLTYSSTGDWNLYFVRTVSVLRRETGLPAHELERRLVNQMVRDLRLPARTGNQSIGELLESSDPEMTSYWRRESIEVAVDHPWPSALMTVVAVERVLFEPFSPLGTTERLMLVFLYVLAILAAVRRKIPGETTLLIGIVLALTVVGTVVFQTASLSARNVVPVLPSIAVMAASTFAPRTTPRANRPNES